MASPYFSCGYCGIELFDEEALDIAAGWTDGEGREVVTCPECAQETTRIDRGRDDE